jgi:hypothetical protein
VWQIQFHGMRGHRQREYQHHEQDQQHVDQRSGIHFRLREGSIIHATPPRL